MQVIDYSVSFVISWYKMIDREKESKNTKISLYYKAYR